MKASRLNEDCQALFDVGEHGVQSEQTALAIRYGVLKVSIYDYSVAIRKGDTRTMREIERFLYSERGQIILGGIDTEWFMDHMKKTASKWAKNRCRLTMPTSEKMSIYS